jgi:RsiW-degrading membrane proteinase PrsW (M82 family)
MSTPSRDPSIEYEPHLQARPPQGDTSEQRAEAILRAERKPHGDTDAVEHTVWDEPVLANDAMTVPPEGALTYARWLQQRIAETSSLSSWLVTLGVVLLAGPWGVFGALLEGFQGNGQITAGGLVAATIVGPVTEEIMKIAIALWIVEKHPYLFKSIGQILICAAAGGLAFGVIENLIYLLVYIPNHSPALAAWRWTVCSGLHLNCSLVAGIGVARIWYNAARSLQRPQLGLGMPWFFTAMVGHGLYNFTALVLQHAGWTPF